MTEDEKIEAAYEYLVKVSGSQVADWARAERNGTWDRAIELLDESAPDTIAET